MRPMWAPDTHHLSPVSARFRPKSPELSHTSLNPRNVAGFMSSTLSNERSAHDVLQPGKLCVPRSGTGAVVYLSRSRQRLCLHLEGQLERGPQRGVGRKDPWSPKSGSPELASPSSDLDEDRCHRHDLMRRSQMTRSGAVRAKLGPANCRSSVEAVPATDLVRRPTFGHRAELPDRFRPTLGSTSPEVSPTQPIYPPAHCLRS